MQVIRKYFVNPFKRNELDLPTGAKILYITVPKRYGAYLWALVDETKPVEKRIFVFFETGQEFNEHHKTYIGTFVMPGYEWHAFELYNAMDPFAKK